MEIDIKPLGDLGIRVGFYENGEQKISPQINQQIRAFAYTLERDGVPGIVELVPTYVALGVYYDPKQIQYCDLKNRLQAIISRIEAVELPAARLIEIPVLYGGEEGPDLEYVATSHNLTIDEVIKLHTSEPYLVYMMGFAPGFPYLGGLPDEIATPRLTNPRPKIRGGSVGIGGQQTGIYPIDAPGGWQIIGHTPLKLYDLERAEPVFLQAGDYLQFVSVSCAEYTNIKNQVNRGEYRIQIKELGEM